MEFLALAVLALAIVAWWAAAIVREKQGDGTGRYRAPRAHKAAPEPQEHPQTATVVPLPQGDASAGIRWKLRPQAAGFSVPYGVIEEVNQSLRRVPPLSQAMIVLLRELGSEASSAQTVGQILGEEPVLAAALLRMSNSSAFGLRREILTVSEAVAFLGFSTTKSLLLRMHLGSLIPPAAPGIGYDASSLWVHAMAVAHVSEELAHRAPGADPALALTAGLLHDIGKIAINSQFPHRVAEVLAAGNGTSAGMLDRERQAFGADHAALGGQLAAQWSLPASIVDIIRLHHSVPSLPDALSPAARRTLLCVHVANQLVKQRHTYCDCVELDPLASQVLEELGLPTDPQQLIDARINEIIQRVFQINGVRTTPPPLAKKVA